MAIMAALTTAAGTTAGKAVIGAVVGNTVGKLFGRSSSKRAKAAQAQQQAIQQEQLAMARKEQDYRFNELRPELQAEQERLGRIAGVADRELGDLYRRNSDMAETYGDRINNVWLPYEDELLAEARAAGGEGDQQFGANRASADTRQALSINAGSQMRMGRSYGGDVNKLMAAQADNAPMGALAEVTAMSRAREAAKKLGWDMRMDAAKLGDRTFTGFDNSSRTALNVGDTWLKSQTLPSQFALDAGRVVAGFGGTGASLYDSAGRSAAGMYDTTQRAASAGTTDFGRYWGTATKDVNWGDLWGSGSSTGGTNYALEPFQGMSSYEVASMMG
jgi:hypothetical protein